MMPPGIKADWDDNPPWLQTLMVAYSQGRRIEDDEAQADFFESLVKVLYPKARSG